MTKYFIWLFLFFIQTCAVAENTEEWNGNFSEVKLATATVIQNKEDWEKSWQKIQSSTAPAINFEKKSVVTLFLGERPTAGYSIKIKKIREKADEIQIFFEEKKPDKNRKKVQLLTRPWTLKVVPKIKTRNKHFVLIKTKSE